MSNQQSERLKLISSIVDYPRYDVEFAFKYHQIRKATVFEEMILFLSSDRKEFANEYIEVITKNLSLDEIFIKKSIQEMVNLHMLKPIDVDEGLRGIKVSDLVQTETGKQFAISKQIPQRSKSATERLIYDPLQNALINPGAKVTRVVLGANNQNSKHISIPNDELGVNNDHVLDLAFQQKEKFSWFDHNVEVNRSDSKIIDMNPTTASASINLVLTNDLKIQITSDSSALTSWIDNRDPYKAKSLFVDPLIAQIHEEVRKKYQLNSDLWNNHVLLTTQWSEIANKNLVLATEELSAEQNSDSIPIISVTPNLSQSTELSIVSTANAVSTVSNRHNGLAIFINQRSNDAEVIGSHLYLPGTHEILSMFNLPTNAISSRVNFKENQLDLVTLSGLRVDYKFQNVFLPMMVKESIPLTGNLVEQRLNSNPSTEELAFWANIVDSNLISEKLGKISINKLENFDKQVKAIAKDSLGNSSYSIDNFKVNLEKLSSENQLSIYKRLFNNRGLNLELLDSKIIKQEVENVLSAPEENKYQELESISKSIIELTPLTMETLDLKLVNQQNFTKLYHWSDEYADLLTKFPELSKEDFKVVEDPFLIAYGRIQRIFKPHESNKKFAVIDTNFLIHHPNAIQDLVSQYQVIIPSVVIRELDKKKKEFNDKASKETAEKDKLDREIADLEQQLKTTNEREQSLNNSLTAVTNIIAERKIKDQLKLISDERAKIKKDLDAKRKLNPISSKTSQDAYKVRQAANSLQANQHSVEDDNAEIVDIIVAGKKPVADDSILAVAAAYKLNDVTLFTGDKNLISKANGYGINTKSTI